jgi:hypothetical protein
MIKGTRRTSVKADCCALALLVAIGLLFAQLWRPTAKNDSSTLGPLARYALPAAQRLRFEGRVVERVPASSYTYLLVERAGGARSWVVTLTSSVGAQSQVSRVRVLAMGYAARFSSKRLARTFDGLYFAVVRPA